MSRINVHRTASARGSRPVAAGFTLVEVMVATSLLAVVLAGVLAAYLFVGRNLTRLVNVQQQEVESRRTLRTFTQDLSAAIQLSTASATVLTLTKPTAVTGVSTTVTYTYSAAAGTLVRTEAGVNSTLLSGLTAFTISYYNEAGTVVSGSPQSVKAIEFAFTSAAGSAASGTRASYTTVSPRVLLRNKPALL